MKQYIQLPEISMFTQNPIPWDEGERFKSHFRDYKPMGSGTKIDNV